MFEEFFAPGSVWSLVLLAALWTLPWKAFALWTAAGLKQKGWFVVLLLVNTLAVLDIFYIFFVAKRSKDSQSSPAKQQGPSYREAGLVDFSDFSKLDLKIARIVSAEKIPQSEKLVKLQIDLGGEARQLVAGIAKAYSPDSLAGKQIVVLANLKPKKLMGEESQGMLLAADMDEGPVLLMPDKEVKPGARVS